MIVKVIKRHNDFEVGWYFRPKDDFDAKAAEQAIKDMFTHARMADLGITIQTGVSPRGARRPIKFVASGCFKVIIHELNNIAHNSCGVAANT